MSDSFNLKFVIFSFLYFYHQLEQALKKLTLLVWLQQCLPQTYTSPAHIFPSGLDILAWRRYDMHIDTLFRIRYIWNTIEKMYHLLHGCHAIHNWITMHRTQQNLIQQCAIRCVTTQHTIRPAQINSSNKIQLDSAVIYITYKKKV